MSRKIIIIGGVAGGASAAARLRRLDEEATIVLLERGDAISFANCGLPYYIGGVISDQKALTVQSVAAFQTRFNIDVRVNHEVTAIDRQQRRLTIKNRKTSEESFESYDELILSPGAEPIKPPLPGVDSERVFTLRNIPDTLRIKNFIATHKPQHAVVVGGGYIGIEMAENLHAAGLAVTVVEMQDQIIAPLDREMAVEVQQHLTSKGVKLMLQHTLSSIDSHAEGLTVRLKEGGELKADMLMLALGVRPETQLARAAGLELNERGAIKVNAQQRSSDPHIFAVGDAVEVLHPVARELTQIPLAGPAAKQGRIAADNLCAVESHYAGTQGSSILRVFDLTVANTGINEKTAQRLGLDIEKIYLNATSHAAYYPGAQPMSIKAIFERQTGKLLGAQIVGGEGVDKRVDVLATALRLGATASDLAQLELCYAPPYSSVKDPVNIIGMAMDNVLKGRVKQFHWHEVANLPRDGSVILLDTRTAIEYQNGTIDGFINIPLDELRQRINELDRTKTIYVTCQGGTRAYLACRILTQRGFDCYNLSGGYRLYRIATSKPTPTLKAMNKPLPTPAPVTASTIKVDACGLQCPGPIVKLSEALKSAADGNTIEIKVTDPAFAADVEAYCQRTGHRLLSLTNQNNICRALIQKGAGTVPAATGNNKNFIVFSGDLDKALASFIMANAAAAMGRKVCMFFTFWGLNILRRPEAIKVEKDFLARMFGWMMPRGSRKLGMSRMNMGGIGAALVRGIMRDKNIDSLEALIQQAQKNGVELIACSMSMDVMGIKAEELIDGVKAGGAAAMLAFAEESDMSLFI